MAKILSTSSAEKYKGIWLLGSILLNVEPKAYAVKAYHDMLGDQSPSRGSDADAFLGMLTCYCSYPSLPSTTPHSYIR